MMKFNAVIFDIDNVLVDTRTSYTDCIRKTVQVYLESVLKFTGSPSLLLTQREIEKFKTLGGFNDDWDTCYGLLLYLLSLPIKHRSIDALRKQKNIQGFVKSIQTRPVGIKGLQRILNCHSELRRSEESQKTVPKLSLNARRSFAALRMTDKNVSLSRISDIFQRYYQDEFVWNEKLLISKTFLKRLKRSGLKLGIVTGRNRDEAGFALRRFQIDSLFDTLVTVDDTPKDKKKPHPYGLLKASELLGKNLRYLYVGDLPDDILAAKAAKKKIKIRSAGFLRASLSPKQMEVELKNAGADYICRNPAELEKIILHA